MDIALVDFETTSLNTDEARIIEIGAAIYQYETGNVLNTYSQLVWEEGDDELSEHISNITGITNEELRGNGIPLKPALAKFAQMSQGCSVFMAHNAPYDRAVLQTNLKTIGIEEPPVEWICSITDLDHGHRKCMKLSHLALDYGITVDPTKLHRALDDVLLLGEILQKRNQGFEEMIEYARSPLAFLILEVPPPWEDQGKGKEFAKSIGYRWENAGDRTFKKKWVKAIKECELDKYKDEETGGYPRKLIRSE